MRDINKVILIGRLTRDVEIKTAGSSNVANFTLAVNDGYKKDGQEVDRVYFHNCVAWSKTGEIIAQYCSKGQRLCVEGKLTQRTWDDKDGNKRSAVEIVVDNFEFLESKKNSDNKKYEISGRVENEFDEPENIFSDSDIPF